MEDQLIIKENLDQLASFTNDTSLNYGAKLLETIFYLGLFAAIAYLFLYLVKSGKVKLPAKFITKSLSVEGLGTEKSLYKFEIIQKQSLPDGNELWVVKTGDRHLLLSKGLRDGLSYLTDLNEKDLITHKSSSDV